MMEENGLMDTISFQREGAEPVDAKVQMSTGKLVVGGGADVLCAGTLKYADDVWKPEVSYNVEEGVGKLLICPPTYNFSSLPNPKYDWKLAFSDDVPLSLHMQVGSGQTDVSLSNTQLQKLIAETGSGPVNISLLGKMTELQRMRLNTGSGPIKAILNGTYSKLEKFKVATGSGNIDLAFGGEFASLSDFTLAAASGQISVALSGEYPGLERLKLDTASGHIAVNLENLQNSIAIAANCVSGDLVVRYPAFMGVGVKINTLTGKFRADGFTRQHGQYVNEAYEYASIRIDISFNAVSGNLRLQPSEG